MASLGPAHGSGKGQAEARGLTSRPVRRRREPAPAPPAGRRSLTVADHRDSDGPGDGHRDRRGRDGHCRCVLAESRLILPARLVKVVRAAPAAGPRIQPGPGTGAARGRRRRRPAVTDGPARSRRAAARRRAVTVTIIMITDHWHDETVISIIMIIIDAARAWQCHGDPK